MFSVNFLSLDSYHAKLRFYKFYPSAHIYSLPDAKSKQYIAGSRLSKKQYTSLSRHPGFPSIQYTTEHTTTVERDDTGLDSF